MNSKGRCSLPHSIKDVYRLLCGLIPSSTLRTAAIAQQADAETKGMAFTNEKVHATAQSRVPYRCDRCARSARLPGNTLHRVLLPILGTRTLRCH